MVCQRTTGCAHRARLLVLLVTILTLATTGWAQTQPQQLESAIASFNGWVTFMRAALTGTQATDLARIAQGKAMLESSAFAAMFPAEKQTLLGYLARIDQLVRATPAGTRYPAEVDQTSKAMANVCQGIRQRLVQMNGGREILQTAPQAPTFDGTTPAATNPAGPPAAPTSTPPATGTATPTGPGPADLMGIGMEGVTPAGTSTTAGAPSGQSNGQPASTNTAPTNPAPTGTAPTGQPAPTGPAGPVTTGAGGLPGNQQGVALPNNPDQMLALIAQLVQQMGGTIQVYRGGSGPNDPGTIRITIPAPGTNQGTVPPVVYPQQPQVPDPRTLPAPTTQTQPAPQPQTQPAPQPPVQRPPTRSRDDIKRLAVQRFTAESWQLPNKRQGEGQWVDVQVMPTSGTTREGRPYAYMGIALWRYNNGTPRYDTALVYYYDGDGNVVAVVDPGPGWRPGRNR